MVELDLLSPKIKDDPHPTMTVLRQTAAAVRIPPYGFYAVGRYDDVARILKHPESFSSSALITLARAMGGDRLDAMLVERGVPPRRAYMVTTDPPDHTRLRSLVTKAFTAKKVADFEPRVRQIVSECIDRILKMEQFDLLDELSVPVPVTVISELLGVDPSRRADFRRWSNAIVKSADMLNWGDTALIEDILRSRVEFHHYLEQATAERRERPRDDLLSDLILAKDEHDMLTADEIMEMVMLLLIAGNETTTNLINNGVTIWLRYPHIREELRANPALIPDFVEETLRYESPVAGVFRTVMKEVDLSGVTIPAGSMVFPIVLSANRDETHFKDPHTFDLHRKEKQHMAFGLGGHYCLGAPLARLQARVVFEEMLGRLPEYALAADEIDWKHSLFFRAVSSLPLRFMEHPCLRPGRRDHRQAPTRTKTALLGAASPDRPPASSPSTLADPAMTTDPLYAPYHPDNVAAPYEMYARMRAEDPVHYWEAGRHWVLTRYDDIAPVLKDPRFTNDIRAWSYYQDSGLVPEEIKRYSDKSLFQLDAAGHARVRKLMSPVFTPRRAAARESLIQEVVDELLDAAKVHERSTIDLIPELAAPLPLQVIRRILGISAEKDEAFRSWSLDAICIVFPAMSPPEVYAAAMSRVPAGYAMIRGFVEERRANPRDDLLSAMIQARDEDDRLDEDELVALVTALVIAGSETTLHVIGRCVINLIRYPEVQAKVRADPSLVPAFIEEVLRSDNPGMGGVVRYALEDVTIGGKTIAKGEMVSCHLGSAMQDESVFPDPRRFDLDRDTVANISFGRGPHFCLGAYLARTEVRVALETLLSRFPVLEAAGEVGYSPHPVIRAVSTLPIRLLPQR